MKRKAKKLKAAGFLLILLIVITNLNICTVTTAEPMSLLTKERGEEEANKTSAKKFFILGFGDISYIGLEKNDREDINQRFKDTNLVITNGKGWFRNYFLFLRNFVDGQSYNKNNLPWKFIIVNFTGYLYKSDYCWSHGPTGTNFKMYGKADDIRMI